jgi:hypothetical protein
MSTHPRGTTHVRPTGPGQPTGPAVVAASTRLVRTARLGSRRALRALRRRLAGDAGMNTAEYAVGTLAAVGFAGLLLKVLTSSSVRSALTGLIERALG